MAGGDEAATTRHCRPRARALGALRPTDVIGAFFLPGLGWMLAGVAAAALQAVEPWAWGRWLALHLIFVGGVSQLVLGASQFFAGAFLATDQAPRKLIRAQLTAWNLGTALVALSAPRGSQLGVWSGTLILLGALMIYGVSLSDMRRRSLAVAPWATRWYLSAAFFLAIGIMGGEVLATGASWTVGNLLGGHMALNLGGFFGMAIVGTLHTFYPSLTQTQLPFPRLQTPTYSAWCVGVGGLAVGYAFSLDAVAVLGWCALGAAAAMLATNIAVCAFRAPGQASLAARIVGTAQLFLVLGVAVALGAAALGGPAEALGGSNRAAVGTLLVGGWIGLTVLGSLLHLLALLLRVRDFSRGMPAPRPRRDLLLTVLCAAGVGSLAVAQLTGAERVEPIAAGLLLAGYLALGWHVSILGARVAIYGRPRI